MDLSASGCFHGPRVQVARRGAKVDAHQYDSLAAILVRLGVALGANLAQADKLHPATFVLWLHLNSMMYTRPSAVGLLFNVAWLG